jgi:hypothetical protein
MLMLQLFLSVGTPVVLKFGLYRDTTFIDWKESGTSMATSTLFLVLFVIQAFSGAVGLLAVCMQRTGSLVLAVVMQIGTAGTTVTALACSVVYIEVGYTAHSHIRHTLHTPHTTYLNTAHTMRTPTPGRVPAADGRGEQFESCAALDRPCQVLLQ